MMSISRGGGGGGERFGPGPSTILGPEAALAHSSPAPRRAVADFESIRTNCMRRGALYEDPEFPTTDAALYYSQQSPLHIDWLRPHDIAGRHGLTPKLFVNDPHKCSLLQGELDQSWLVPAAACLSDSRLIFALLPQGQGFQDSWYAGMFRVKLWYFGQWVEVTVDDRLPTARGELVHVRSKEPNEFWGPLLQKACAKLAGSYEALKSHMLSDTLHQLTGGLVESYYLRDSNPLPQTLDALAARALNHRALTCCWIKPVAGRAVTAMQNGLMAGSSYTITCVREVKLTSDRTEVPAILFRLRNPWGNPVSWSGAWGQRSAEWTALSAYDRQQVGLTIEEDGEFWMQLSDFQREFDTVDVCHLGSESAGGGPGRGYTSYTFPGRWIPGVSAGGRPVCMETHCLNPQYLLTLNECDVTTNGCTTSQVTCLVELTQGEPPSPVGDDPASGIDMGFVIYKVYPNYSLPLDKQYFLDHTFVDRCDFYTNTHQVTKRFLLAPGQYVAMPTTYDPDTEAEYLLRIFFEGNNKVESIPKDRRFMRPVSTADSIISRVEYSTPQTQVSKVPARPYEDVSFSPIRENNTDTLQSRHSPDVSRMLNASRVSSLPVDQSLMKDVELDAKNYFFDTSGRPVLINVFAVRKVLNSALEMDPNHEDLSLHACRAMLTLVDFDGTGKMGYYEFVYLWNMLKNWRKTFYAFERNGRARLSPQELGSAISSLGFKLEESAVERLIFWFGDEDDFITLDSFLHCMVKVMAIFDVYKTFHLKQKIGFTLNEFLDKAVII